MRVSPRHFIIKIGIAMKYIISVLVLIVVMAVWGQGLNPQEGVDYIQLYFTTWPMDPDLWTRRDERFLIWGVHLYQPSDSLARAVGHKYRADHWNSTIWIWFFDTDSLPPTAMVMFDPQAVGRYLYDHRTGGTALWWKGIGNKIIY